MPHPASTLQQLKESPQWILLPSKKGDALFVAALAATLVLCIVSFFLTSVML